MAKNSVGGTKFWIHVICKVAKTSVGGPKFWIHVICKVAKNSVGGTHFWMSRSCPNWLWLGFGCDILKSNTPWSIGSAIQNPD